MGFFAAYGCVHQRVRILVKEHERVHLYKRTEFYSFQKRLKLKKTEMHQVFIDTKMHLDFNEDLCGLKQQTAKLLKQGMEQYTYSE
jgi:hypothetical protein